MDQKQQEMTAMDRLEAILNVLDKMADLPGGGRTKCGYIWVMNDLINGLANDILIMEDKIKTYEGKKEEPAPEVKLEVVKDEEDGNDEETAE